MHSRLASLQNYRLLDKTKTASKYEAENIRGTTQIAD